jgi:2-oxoglutarate ferredoxin oxidoreductase subunit alpha
LLNAICSFDNRLIFRIHAANCLGTIFLRKVSKEMREFINGSDAIVRGAIDAGCNFFAGYPITPATPILLSMVRELPKVGGIAIQAEDEIAALGFCIGASVAGARVMTATSGPGISLYSENIGAAIMGEIPVVIVDCQRLGPATGGATTVGQGDIQFLRWGTSGGYPVIVLSPASVTQCYSLTQRAFDLAERYRLPVFLATDKEMVANNMTVDVAAFEKIDVKERDSNLSENRLKAYHLDDIEQVPPMSFVSGPHLVRFTTASHDEGGYISKEPDAIGPIHHHLADKVETAIDEIAIVDDDLQDGADTLLVSYGITARSMYSAAKIARSQGVKLSTLTIQTLWPVPERGLINAMNGIKKIIVAELNLGQYRREIERLSKNGQEVVGVHRIDGRLITPSDILERL